jgi:hypothetical protein
MNNKIRWIERNRRNLERKSYDSKDSARLLKLFLEFMLFGESKDMLSQNVHISMMK